ncbi:ABC transporter ATP-binding protein [Agrobacterium fabrum]|jgi:sulfonate transport system ATP-binding protein|uniref:Aliphatic sulfonates import ATP-binding protein SsuB 1 n=2 Tax=Agrobacterium fabrum TaxID=1176649 RepID=SSUB1_AGRFC|nr:ABC transporter ATP-binding protein [Agrobacterium fabrum]Q8U8D6.1 RecName: Full=Aliphatic sulfonates import ATP-binding protein SsuB 1 [Agrobacterium fabrum str. C58]KEY56418.1 aliphatic sulfonate ABC transporter ATP-binding protein [Agrobacterium tumefaciens]AAK89278.1 ABC transporter, nucleotide binding/ATPase protein (aliphatic sulfonate) [Agrobacterium fabrum str. C58]AYM64937.1 sulfonate transport system ATP-binding protein [Agrobacterium fabrum]KJX86213.1 aliphatic sulfonates ABC tra
MSTGNVTTLRRPEAPPSLPAGTEAKIEHHARPAEGKVAFSFRNVTKSFGDKPVLRGIDLDVREGEFLAVIGKSGCGKSTLLRILAGLDTPTTGTVSKDPSNRTRMMFQEPRLLPWERIANNVSVGLTGIAKGEAAREQALGILDEVGLKDRAGEWPYVLSGGQKQRVALARALVAHPQILALDEPLGALDALTRIEMQLLLERIWRKQKFTAVLVTHDVSEAVALADRIVVIDEGRIALDLDVKLPRPRRHGTPEFARLEEQVLNQLFGRGDITGQ